MVYLIVNIGSSSKKYALYHGDACVRAWHFEDTGEHGEEVLKEVDTQGARLDGIGFRVVHGGQYKESLKIDEEVLGKLEAIRGLAPLHNGPALAEIKRFMELRSTVPLVAVFDTSFHQTMPEYARRYALPETLVTDPHHLVRYGFHGISYQSIVQKTNHLLGFLPSRLIACHLGAGTSMCAILHGKSIDTSMGFTPLEGLIMGTRSGDIDPGIIFHVQKEFNFSADEMDHLLNSAAGLKGIAGDADVRNLIAREKQGDPSATLALAMFSYRVRKYIGAYTAVLGGLDALVFTAAIGEGSPFMREKFCKGMGSLGIDLDRRANARHTGDSEGEIGTATSPVKLLVLKTDEMGEIARQMHETIG